MKIKELKIYTQNISNQTDFYENKIGLKIIEKSQSEVSFQIGKSVLRLIENDKFQPYHFAINIPSNKVKEALDWLKSSVTILKDGENEIQNFDFDLWNAKAIYFYDHDKNIVEFIGRKNLGNESNEDFSANSLIEISEIGIPVNNIEATYNTLKETTNIEIFDGGFEKFCAIGDETGLFICIDKSKKDWYPTGDKAYSSEFNIRLEEKEREFELEFVDGEIKSLNK